MQSFASIAAKCAVFRLKDYAWLSYFHGVPSATGNLATKTPLLGVEAVALYFGAVVIKNYLIETVDNAHYALGRVWVTMHRHLSAGHQGIQYSL